MYPLDLDRELFWKFDLEYYRKLVLKEAERVFSTAQSTTIKLLSSPSQSDILVSSCVGPLTSQETPSSAVFQFRSPEELQCILHKIGLDNGTVIQHYFIHSRSSLSRLCITQGMLESLFTIHRVFPSFLDLVFTYGEQRRKKNFHCSGFRAFELCQGDALSPSPACHYQMCYNLHSVEHAIDPPEWPWSIRQIALFHSFECDTGKAIWIEIKSGQDNSEMISQLISKAGFLRSTQRITPEATFHASLATHVAYFEQVGRNWATYVSFLEDRLQCETGHAFLARAAGAPEPKRGRIQRDGVRDGLTSSHVESRSDKWEETNSGSLNKSSNKSKQHLTDGELRPAAEKDARSMRSQDFSYDDLRSLQHIEEQANIARLAISSNISIITTVHKYYLSLCASSTFHASWSGVPQQALFSAQVLIATDDSKLQEIRIQALLQLIANRKALLLQLFAHRNMLANVNLADKAQISAEKMEDLTEEMKQIALKTEKETIFMRIITVVTLFFLPGTFVATLMSTDILRFQDNGKQVRMFSAEALGVYSAVTIPVMGIAFWSAFYFWRQATLRNAAQRSKHNALL